MVNKKTKNNHNNKDNIMAHNKTNRKKQRGMLNRVIWIVAFVFMFYVPQLIYLLAGDKLASDSKDNREKLQKPEFAFENIESFPSLYEDYYNDNLPFRDELVKLNNNLEYWLLNDSASDRVLLGKNNFMFYKDNNDENPVAISTGSWLFTEEELAVIADDLKNTESVLKMQGVEFVLYIAPNKETVYIDYFPDYYNHDIKETATTQLVSYLRENTDIRVVFPREELTEAARSSEKKLYQELDTHWNYLGAYIGAKYLLEELDLSIPEIDTLDISENNRDTGDVANILNVTIKSGNSDFLVDGYTDRKPKLKFSQNNYICESTNSKADKRKLFVCRDSYFEYMYDYIGSQFNDAYYVHRDLFNEQQIFSYDADVFVYETVERSVKQLMNFEINSVTYDAEDLGDGTTKLVFKPTIEGTKLDYVSIYTADSLTQKSRIVQELKSIDGAYIIVPNDKPTETYVYVYGDENGEQQLDSISIRWGN